MLPLLTPRLRVQQHKGSQKGQASALQGSVGKAAGILVECLNLQDTEAAAAARKGLHYYIVEADGDPTSPRTEFCRNCSGTRCDGANSGCARGYWLC